VRVIKTLRLALEVGEEIVAQIELNVAGDADEDPAREKEEDALERGDSQQQKRIVQNFGAGDAVLHIIYGAADDERKEDPEAVGEQNGDAAPEQAHAIALEVRNERSQAMGKHSTLTVNSKK